MKIFEFSVSDEPKPRKKYRYGEIRKIVYNNGDEFLGNPLDLRLTNKPPLVRDLDNVQRIVMEGRYQKRPEEPYPNFLQPRYSFFCVDEQARMFLDALHISYKSIPTEVSNEPSCSYRYVVPEKIPNLIALEESNAYMTSEGFIFTTGKKYFSPISSKIVLKKESLNIKGLYALKEMPTIICDEETKEKLEKSGLTGFRFEELEVLQ